MNEKKITTIAEAEAYAAERGIALSPKDRQAIAATQQAELQRLELLYKDNQPRTIADRWNDFYPRFVEMMVTLGRAIIMSFETVLNNLGVPIVLTLLMIVEQSRVMHGIQMFEADPALASFSAWTIVIFNLLLELQVHYIEYKAGYVPDRDSRWSMRIWLRNMAYRFGVGEQWQEQHLSPAMRQKKLLSLLTFTILALALTGSMRSVIEAQPGRWYEAIASIALESNLSLMLTWSGGLLFAGTAVLGAQVLSRHLGVLCMEIIASMKERQQFQSDPHAAAVEQAGATAVISMINKKLAEKESKAASHFLALQTNGNGNGNHNGNGHYSLTE